jgi:hypothetical protein
LTHDPARKLTNATGNGRGYAFDCVHVGHESLPRAARHGAQTTGNILGAPANRIVGLSDAATGGLDCAPSVLNVATKILAHVIPEPSRFIDVVAEPSKLAAELLGTFHEA